LLRLDDHAREEVIAKLDVQLKEAGEFLRFSRGF
jgi:hypothetical protein